MKKVFSTVNNNLTLITPLILFMLLIMLVISVSMFSNRAIAHLIALILIIHISAIFIAGWFNMIKNVVINSTNSKTFEGFKTFYDGIGNYFLPSTGAILISSLLLFLILGISYYLGISLIGNPNLDLKTFSEALTNSEAIKTFLASLSKEQILQIYNWNLLIILSSLLIQFLLILYFPVIFFKNKNPIFALLISFKDLFSKKIVKTMGVFLLIVFCNFTLSLFSSIFGNYPFIHFLITLLNFYVTTAIFVGIFHYYYNSFIDKKIGQNIDIKI